MDTQPKIKGFIQFFSGIGLIMFALLDPRFFLIFQPIGLSGVSWAMTIIIGVWSWYNSLSVWMKPSVKKVETRK